MQTSQDVARHNYNVISCLLQGDHDTALTHSHAALNGIQAILNLPRWTDDSAMMMMDQEEPEDLPCAIWSVPLSAGGKKQHEPLSMANEGSVAFFSRALAFHHTHEDISTEDKDHQQSHQEEEDVVLAAVVLYNTGLCHHACAIQSAHLRTSRLQKALRMYTMASCLLTSASDSPEELLTECSNEGVALLVLALLNNTAHIHSFFSNAERASEFMEAMEEFFASSSIGMGEGDEDSMPEDILMLSMSSTLYREESFAACPAA